MLPKEPGADASSSSGEREPHAAISLSLAQALWRNASSNSSFITPPLSGEQYGYILYDPQIFNVNSRSIRVHISPGENFFVVSLRTLFVKQSDCDCSNLHIAE